MGVTFLQNAFFRLVRWASRKQPRDFRLDHIRNFQTTPTRLALGARRIVFASRCPPAFFRRTAIILKTNMPRAKSRRPRAKCHRPWAFSEIHKNQRKTLLFHGSALLGSMLRRSFLVIFRCWAPCGRRLGALWRLWGALCRLWGPLWRLWVATWRPKARPGTPSRLYPGASGGRVTRFWSPRALGKQPNFDGKGP